jgi:glycosyltransferase involved in cell wall biosynthesis
MDYNLKRIDLPKLKIEYVSRSGPKVFRSLRYYLTIIKSIRLIPYDLIIIYYFNSCSVLKLMFPDEKFLLDIRTSAIKNIAVKRLIWNLKLRLEIKVFQNVTVLSHSLAKKIGLKKNHYHLLPLGADEISEASKAFSSFNFIYVGSFLKRNIHETVEGFAYFYKEFSEKIRLSYVIIGFGSENDIELIKKMIVKSHLQDVVRVIGQVPYTELKSYFDNANIGISYVPMTDYFDCQPATKTFEYIMSGMFCLATDTSENRKVITAENGLLCKDNPTALYNAMKQLYLKKNTLNDQVIRKSLDAFKWENIVNNNLKNYIEELTND